MAETIYSVEVQPDFMQKLAHVQPVTGIAELIWNALDADADSVSVILDDVSLGQERLIVRDNGEGFGYEDAPKFFRNLGNSWKRGRHTTERGRHLHGSEGQGRFKALAVGRVVEWKVVHKKAEKKFEQFTVWVAADQPSKVHVSELAVLESAIPGVTVTVSELAKGFTLLKGEGAAQALCEMFASYLKTYPSVRISTPIGPLDPAAAIWASKRVELPVIRYQDVDHAAHVELNEWKVQTERYIYFCNENGLALHRTHPRFHAPGFNFSAHLQSSVVTRLAEDGVLGLEDMDPLLAPTMDRLAEEVKAFHRERLAVDARDAVEEWKAQAIYPFEGEAVSTIERVEREVFDIIASRVNQHLPDFNEAGKKGKQFQLQLLRRAIEKSPDDLRAILSQVLDLPQNQRRELAELLDYVSLSGIISAARMIADRLQFIAGLEGLLYSTNERKVLKERRQLHRLLIPHTWLFGETFALSVDDQSLNEVLKKHIEEAGRSDVDLATPVMRPDNKKGIVDLMFSRRIPRGATDERDHLVVELKRPSLKVTSKELNQVKQYAAAVAKDERFRMVTATWDFWLLVNDYDEFVQLDANQKNRPIGLAWEMEHPQPRVRVWVKTWAQVIEENKARLRFVEERLGFAPDQQQSLQAIKERYAHLFAKGESAADEQLANEDEVKDNDRIARAV